MNIIERAKRQIAELRVARKRPLRTIAESDGPFQYEYVSISHVLGAKLPVSSPDPLQIAYFPDINATAYLTHNWDKQYFHIDRAKSVAILLLTGLEGAERFNKLSRYVDRFLKWIFGPGWVFMRNLEAQAMRIREQRLKDHPDSGCCLVYRARGQVDQPINLNVSQIFDKVGVALDAFNGLVVREQHKLNVGSVATSVSLAMVDTNGSPEIQFLDDNVHLLSKDELVIYARTFKFGIADLVNVTTISSDELIPAIKTYTMRFSADNKLSSTASLFAWSQYKSNDNLRSFIASWAALELLICNLEKKYRSDFKTLLSSTNIALPAWDRDLSKTEIKDYRLRDRFYAVACSINLDEAETDIEKFNELNSRRNDYYHKFKIKDTELPTDDVQALFRKYLKIVLSTPLD